MVSTTSSGNNKRMEHFGSIVTMETLATAPPHYLLTSSSKALPPEKGSVPPRLVAVLSRSRLLKGFTIPDDNQ